MTLADRIGSWLALAVGSAIVVAVAFPEGVYRIQQFYAGRFGLAPQVGFLLAVLVGIAAAFALVAPAGVWIATRIFGYTVSPPAHRGRTFSVAFVLGVIGFFVLLVAAPVGRE
jgi:hypothetical protein